MWDALHAGYDAADRLTGFWDRDPLRRFEPYDKQIPFLACEKQEAYFCGANRTGKTKCEGAIVASYARYGVLNPLKAQQGYRGSDRPKNIWCISLTGAMSKKLLQPVIWGNGEDPATEPFIPAEEIRHFREKPEPTLYLHNGTTITFKSAEQGASRFEGAAIDLAVFDEPPPESVYKAVAIRIGKDRNAYIRMGATLLPPEGQTGGVTQWLYVQKLQPVKEGKPHALFEAFGAGMRDNPHLTEEQIRAVEAVYPPGSIDRRIRVQGEWLPGLLGNRCYASFDRRLQVNRELGPHSVDPYQPLLFAFDSNVAPLCSVVAQKHGPIYRIHDEIVFPSGTIERFGEQLMQRYPGLRNEILIYGDATAESRTAQTGKTDYDLLSASLANVPHQTKILSKNPPERDRVNVVNFWLGGNGNPVRMEIAPHCYSLIADLEQVIWDQDGGKIRKSRNMQDAYYQRTHSSDALGYLLYFREPACIRAVASGFQRKERVKIPAPRYGFAHHG